MKFEFTYEERRILEKAAHRWGKEHEHNMACEELSETITSLCHFRRGRVDFDDVIEELGDAIVCVAQVVQREGLGPCHIDIERAIATSLGKLAAKLEHDDKNHGEDR